MVCLTVLSPIVFIMLPILFPNYKIIGKLTITNSSINISDDLQKENLLPFNEIKQLKIEFNETASDGGYGIKLGINNHIFITSKADIVYHYQIKIINPQSVRIINEKLDYLKEHFEIIKKRKGKKVSSLINK